MLLNFYLPPIPPLIELFFYVSFFPSLFYCILSGAIIRDEDRNEMTF